MLRKPKLSLWNPIFFHFITEKVKKWTLTTSIMDSADAGCFFHTVTDCKETVIKVTDKQWCTANEYAVRWVQIYGDAQKKAIAQKILNTQSNSDLLCHYACYKNFCNKLVIERAEVKQAKREQESTEEVSVSNNYFKIRPDRTNICGCAIINDILLYSTGISWLVS